MVGLLKMCEAASSSRRDADIAVFARHLTNSAHRPNGVESGVDDELTTTSSILEFLQQERHCDGTATGEEEDGSELDIDSIFEEINRLSGDTRGRCVEDILREAEALITKQELGQLEVPGRRGKKMTLMPSRLPMPKRASGTESSARTNASRADDDCDKRRNEEEDMKEMQQIVHSNAVEDSDEETRFDAHFVMTKVSKNISGFRSTFKLFI